jgi:Ca2+-dependent lipid-binding protein
MSVLIICTIVQVDWLNKFISDMWPSLDKAICSTIRSTAQPIFEEYIGKFQIKAIEFKNLSLGTLPPAIFGECILGIE